jgi:hypothetical protein
MWGRDSGTYYGTRIICSFKAWEKHGLKRHRLCSTRLGRVAWIVTVRMEGPNSDRINLSCLVYRAPSPCTKVLWFMLVEMQVR